MVDPLVETKTLATSVPTVVETSVPVAAQVAIVHEPIVGNVEHPVPELTLENLRDHIRVEHSKGVCYTIFCPSDVRVPNLAKWVREGVGVGKEKLEGVLAKARARLASQ